VAAGSALHQHRRGHLYRKLLPVGRVLLVIGVCAGLELALTMPDGSPLARLSVLAVAAAAGLWMPVGVILAAAILSVRVLGSTAVIGSVGVADVLLLLVVARLAVRMIGADAVPISVPSQWLLLFTLWLWLATILSHESITPILRLTLYVLLAVVLASAASPKTRTIYLILILYAAAELIISLPAQLPGRVVGSTVGDPHQLSILCLAALAPLLAAVRTFPGRRFLIGFLVFGIFATRTRGAWGALLVILVVSQMSRLSSRRLVGIMVGFVTAGVILYGPVTQMFGLNASSKGIREQSVLEGVRAGMEAPVLGKGWNADLSLTGLSRQESDDPSSRTQPFNVFVSVFAFTGLPGLILWIGFLVHLLRVIIARTRTGFLFLAAFLAFSLSEMTIYAGALGTVIFFVYAGICQRPPEAERRIEPVAADAAGSTPLGGVDTPVG